MYLSFVLVDVHVNWVDNQYMKITKTCVYTNRKNTIEIDITKDAYTRFKQGEDIDVALPTITYEERQFLLTGELPGDEEGFC